MIFFHKFTFWLAHIGAFLLLRLIKVLSHLGIHSFRVTHHIRSFKFHSLFNLSKMSKLCDINSILDFSEVNKVIDDFNHVEVALSNAKALLEKLANSEVKDDDSNSVETILENPAETKMTWVPLPELTFSYLKANVLSL